MCEMPERRKALSVWNSVQPEMTAIDKYLAGLFCLLQGNQAARERVMDEARKQQLIVSYKILDGNLPGKDEWNMMLLVEQKNWAAFDGAGDKFDAIAESLVGPEKAQMESLIKRSDMREIVGVRNFQEINFK